MVEAPASGRRRRRWLVALVVLAALALAAAILVHRYSRPQRLADFLAEQVREQLGAELQLGGEAGFQLTPRLRAVLPRPRLVADGRVILEADAIAASVPWRTLWADHLDIEQVELQRPRLDLDALRAWLASRPASAAPTPDVRLALRIVDGEVVAGGAPVAQGIQADFSNHADLVAWLAALRRDGDARTLLPPASGSASAETLQFGQTRLEDVRVELRDDAPAPRP